MEASAAVGDPTERANELYWGSDRSVNQIADDLDLSKGALYSVIQPLAAERGCPRCGSEVVYANRTAKERGRLDCQECDWDGVADETVEWQPDEEEVTALAESYADPPAETDPVRTMMGGALLGAAAGLALVLWARRR